MSKYSKARHLATSKTRAERIAEPQGWALPQAFRFGDFVLDRLPGRERWMRIRSRCVQVEPGTWAAMVSLETDENLIEARFDGAHLRRVAAARQPELSRWQA